MLADFKLHEDIVLSDGSPLSTRKLPPDAGGPWRSKSADPAHAIVESDHGRDKVEKLSTLVANRLPSRRF